MPVKTYRKKPVEVEAVEWTGDDLSEITTWAGAFVEKHPANDNELSVVTDRGAVSAQKGDYIIKGVQGEFYPCAKDVFVATYDAVEAE